MTTMLDKLAELELAKGKQLDKQADLLYSIKSQMDEADVEIDRLDQEQFALWLDMLEGKPLESTMLNLIADVPTARAFYNYGNASTRGKDFVDSVLRQLIALPNNYAINWSWSDTENNDEKVPQFLISLPRVQGINESILSGTVKLLHTATAASVKIDPEHIIPLHTPLRPRWVSVWIAPVVKNGKVLSYDLKMSDDQARDSRTIFSSPDLLEILEGCLGKYQAVLGIF